MQESPERSLCVCRGAGAGAAQVTASLSLAVAEWGDCDCDERLCSLALFARPTRSLAAVSLAASTLARLSQQPYNHRVP